MPILRPTGRRSSIALNGELELAGPTGRRRVAAKDFFVDIMTTALEPDEVLVAIHIPRPDPGAQFRYRKIRHPASGYAVVGVAVALRLHDGVVSEATIAITGATGRAFAAESASSASDRQAAIERKHRARRIACQRTGRVPVGPLRVGGLSQASRQDRGQQGVGVAEWCLSGPADLRR